jgi:hypothetical protein
LAVKPKTAHDIIAGLGRVGKSLDAAVPGGPGAVPNDAAFDDRLQWGSRVQPSRALGWGVLMFLMLIQLL